MKWLIEKWDWFIYWLAYRSINRICKRNIGHAYLMELAIRDWIAEQGMPDSLKRSTEAFHEAMKRYDEPIVDENGVQCED